MIAICSPRTQYFLIYGLVSSLTTWFSSPGFWWENFHMDNVLCEFVHLQIHGKIYFDSWNIPSFEYVGRGPAWLRGVLPHLPSLATSFVFVFSSNHSLVAVQGPGVCPSIQRCPSSALPVTEYLKPLFGRPGPPGLKCTSAAAPTLQQTVACGLWGFKGISLDLNLNPKVQSAATVMAAVLYILYQEDPVFPPLASIPCRLPLRGREISYICVVTLTTLQEHLPFENKVTFLDAHQDIEHYELLRIRKNYAKWDNSWWSFSCLNKHPGGLGKWGNGLFQSLPHCFTFTFI